MSIRRLQELYAKPRCWTPNQWGILNALAWYERESVGHAWPSVDLLMDRTGYGRRRVLQLLEELRRNRLAEPLGRAHQIKGRPQRWRLTLDQHEARPVPLPLDVAPDPPVSAVDARSNNPEVTIRPAEQMGATLWKTWGGEGKSLVQPVAPSEGENLAFMVQPAAPSTCDPLLLDLVSTYVQPIKLKEATAAPRLPLLGATPKKLQAIVAPKTPYQHVADVVQKLLRNPVRASRLIGLDPPITRWTQEAHETQKGDLLEAAKTYCARGHINGWEDTVCPAVECEWFKHFHQDVIRGGAPRPRQLRR